MPIALNTFLGGLNLDKNYLDLTNADRLLTYALNATLLTYNGNERSLLNDLGNIKIKYGEDQYASLTEGFIPIGITSFGGIAYIVSCCKKLDNTWIGEIGCFPSPDYNSEEKLVQLINKYEPLHVGKKTVNKLLNENASLTSTLFNFDFNHPVTIDVETSFDGSVNLIINDNKNYPKLINSGFAVTDNNTCRIINRYGSNNTNRYDLDNDLNFKLQTSLYKTTDSLARFEFNGLQTGGLLPVGNYTFYAIASDKDGNETDIICESGVVSVFHGNDGDPFSVRGGMLLEVTDKSVSLTVKGIDKAYNYIHIIYSVATAADDEFAKSLFKRIIKEYPVTDGECKLTITGYEDTQGATSLDVNILYFNANLVKAQAISLNMLFLGNVTLDNGNDTNEYELLTKAGLMIHPYYVTAKKVKLDSDYNYIDEDSTDKNSYYNSKFIYYNTGYHAEEFYRFGVVFIRLDNSKTDVFNVLGVKELSANAHDGIDELKIKVPNTSNELWWTGDKWSNQMGNCTYNSKGVVRIPAGAINYLTDIIGIAFDTLKIPEDVTKKYKGFFFVRLKRIPTILCLGYSTNVCEEAYVPSLNVKSKEGKTYHYFESFATGTAYQLPKPLDENYYPKRALLGNGNTLSLRNNYDSRLFSLSDYTRAYFDKKPGGMDAVLYYYANEINYLFNSDLWFYGPSITLYGSNNEEDEYCVLISTNGDGTLKSKYGVDLYFFIKKTNLDENDTDTYIENDDKGNAIIKSHWKLSLNEQAIYKDDDVLSAIQQHFDAWWDNSETFYKQNKEYKSSVETTFDDNSNVSLPKYVKYNNTIYLFYCCGPHPWKSYLSLINSNCNNWFAGYALTDDNAQQSQDGTIDSNLDLTIPTFDGKYHYTPIKSNKDTASVAMNSMEYNSYAVFCPEVELNQPYYNNILTGTNIASRPITKEAFLSRSNRRYSYSETKCDNAQTAINVKALNVPENVSLLSIENNSENNGGYVQRNGQSFFSTKVGDATNPNFKFVGPKFLAYNPPTAQTVSSIESGSYGTYGKVHPEKPYNMVRGVYGSYVGLVPLDGNESGNFVNRILNLYIPNYDTNKFGEYFNLRFLDSTAYYTISDYQSFADNDSAETNNSHVICYRGDCYINWYTHRVNRNFNDPSAPYNDTILDSTTFYEMFKNCFKPEYRTLDLTAKGDKDTDLPYIDKFNLGDLNAVSLGSWVTFPCRSSRNLALRANDESWTTEAMAAGHARTFYPVYPLDAGGSNKIPESTAFNSGYDKSGGDKLYFNSLTNIYDKAYYKNRILYSNVRVNSLYSNGNRVFLLTHYRDYTDLYGEIVKLVEHSVNGNSSLYCICEHGILLIPINERALASEGTGGNIYINTSNVLPENPLIVSDTFGTQWLESVIKTPYGIYGIDAVAKKIWKINGLLLETISDFNVLSFLNTTLPMYNKLLELGLVNIKTHYNAFKKDVMFTAYDFNALVLWNLCYNENLAVGGNGWLTFYSWIPSCSTNIGNTYLSFNTMVDHSINPGNHEHNDSQNYLTNYLWVHGQSDSITETASIKPTHWYGELHPFEFSFVVNKDPANHKVFNTMQIISNNVAPESFHYNVVGDAYEIQNDKTNVYLRLELTKILYSTINANNTNNLKELLGMNVSTYLLGMSPSTDKKSPNVIFPWYYYRFDKRDMIQDYYNKIQQNGFNFDNLSGTEVYYDKLTDEYRLCNHVPAKEIDKVGRIRGNMHYKLDLWNVTINPIEYYLIDVIIGITDGKLTLPGCVLMYEDNTIFDVSQNIDFNDFNQKLQDLGYNKYNYQINDISSKAYNWTNYRKEMRVRDKFLETTVRYPGDKLAIIQGIMTNYIHSFA